MKKNFRIISFLTALTVFLQVNTPYIALAQQFIITPSTSLVPPPINLAFGTRDIRPVLDIDLARIPSTSNVFLRKTIVDGINSGSDLRLPAGRQVRSPSALSVSHAVIYDKNSNLTKHTRPNLKVINYAYDALNRLTGKTYPQNTPLNTTYVYDLASRLTDANNAANAIHYTYDALNRSDIVTQTIGSLTPLSINYDYDKAGNRTKITYPSGKVVDYTYDGNNRMDLVKVNTTTLSDYTYDPLGRRISKVLPQTPNNLATTYQYDMANQLTQIKNQITGGGVISQYDYTLYDNIGNRKTLQFIQGIQPQQTINYSYNNIYELTSVTGGQTHSYDYDSVANREVADSVVYTANNLNQYTNVGSTAYGYDGNGNLTSDGVNSFDYDEDNRLRVFNAPGTTNDAVYSYDAFNRRVSKTVNGVTTYFINDGDREIEERSGAGVLLADYVFGDSIDEVLAMKRGANTYYYHYDGLGSVTELTNAAGIIQESYQYDPYGNPSVTNSTIGNPFRFTGRRLDEESGVYYYRNRMYSPAIGRFLQRDPIGYWDSMNLLQYTKNNPINFTDPLGLARYPIPEKEFERRQKEYWERHRNRNQNNRPPQNAPQYDPNRGGYYDESGNRWNKDLWNPFHKGDSFRGTGKYSGSQGEYDENGNRIGGGTYDFSPPVWWNPKTWWDHYWDDVYPHLVQPDQYKEFPKPCGGNEK